MKLHVALNNAPKNLQGFQPRMAWFVYWNENPSLLRYSKLMFSCSNEYKTVE